MRSKRGTIESGNYRIIYGQAMEKFEFINQQPPQKDRPEFYI